MNRNRALKLNGLAALLGAALLFVTVAAPSADAQTPAKKDPENANRTLVWIPKTVNSTFWLAVLEGTKKADRKSTRLNSSHIQKSRMPSSA